jgi:CRP/FNR family transcriptional regulator
MFVTFDSQFLSRAPAISVPSRDASGALREPKVRLKQGQILYRQGDDASSVFRVTEGVLRLACVTERGHQQVVAFGYPGDIVGFPVRGLRTTECDALTPATVMPIPARLPEGGSAGAAEAGFLAAAALWEIGAMQEHLMTLGRKSSRERVASFLVALMRRVGQHDAAGIHIDLPMSRADIADFLGLRTETVSRAFTDLRQAGVIALPSAQHVTVRDPQGLGEAADGD